VGGRGGGRGSGRLLTHIILITALLGHRNTARTKKLDFKNSHLAFVGATTTNAHEHFKCPYHTTEVLYSAHICRLDARSMNLLDGAAVWAGGLSGILLSPTHTQDEHITLGTRRSSLGETVAAKQTELWAHFFYLAMANVISLMSMQILPST
jgi:hypothetical protein